MALIFTAISSAADYGTFGRWLLLVITVVSWASQYAEMAVTGGYFDICIYRNTLLQKLKAPSHWPLAMVLYMINFITYGAALVFYAAVFPRLARNTVYTRTLRTMYEIGAINRKVLEMEESLEKNRISNISTVCLFRSALSISLNSYYIAI